MKSPDEMRPQERIEEIATILAEGVLRLKQRMMRKSKRFRDVLLDSSPDQSVHATKPEQEESA
ncbi:MAG: hypothetical protein KGJ21_02800 [Pseudomonadota bacterium]|nr:hypothetical protein [Pseudomonadota bacterium]